MNPITIPNISIPTIGIPTIGILSVGFPSASGGGGLSWPAGMKEHIKAWYDPKKQGMTNYDVIESYVEDFTYWVLDNTGITSTPKKIVIPAGTKLKYTIAFRGFNSFTAGFDIKYTGNAVITYRYNKEDGTVGTIAINESGIYHLPAGIKTRKNFGFYCNPQTVTEEATIEQLPTSILKDLSGNGNHAYLYGGKGKLNSGMGVYKEDFLTFTNQFDPKEPYEKSSNKYIIYCSKDYHTNFWQSVKPVLGITTYHSFKIKFTGLPEEGARCTIYKGIDYSEREYLTVYNGENIIPEHTVNVVTAGLGAQNVIDFNLEKIENTITIEQIPDYPDQLCYDGKMYAVCYDFPILTDYTVMAERTWFEKQNGAFISKSNNPGQGAFIFENILSGAQNTYSFAQPNSISIQDGISYQTKNSYNGSSLSVGTGFDNPNLVIGRMRDTSEVYYVGCHGKIIIADRSFTEDEITWLKDNWEKI
jgi:hypothetical protein